MISHNNAPPCKARCVISPVKNKMIQCEHQIRMGNKRAILNFYQGTLNRRHLHRGTGKYGRPVPVLFSAFVQAAGK